jgi:hypothetical protein
MIRESTAARWPVSTGREETHRCSGNRYWPDAIADIIRRLRDGAHPTLEAMRRENPDRASRQAPWRKSKLSERDDSHDARISVACGGRYPFA